jgi:hypothetical protein
MSPKIYIDHVKSKRIEDPDEFRLYHPDKHARDGENPDKYFGVITDECLAYEIQDAYNNTYAKEIDPEAFEKMKEALESVLELLQEEAFFGTARKIKEVLDSARLPNPTTV